MQDAKAKEEAAASSSTEQEATAQNTHTIKRPWEDAAENGKDATSHDNHAQRPPVPPPPMDSADEQDKATERADTVTPAQTAEAATLPTARGPNKNVNYKLKFQRARDQYTKAQLKTKKALETLHDAQRKERRLQEEVDYLLDALAARREDLVRAALET